MLQEKMFKYQDNITSLSRSDYFILPAADFLSGNFLTGYPNIKKFKIVFNQPITIFTDYSFVPVVPHKNPFVYEFHDDNPHHTVHIQNAHNGLTLTIYYEEEQD